MKETFFDPSWHRVGSLKPMLRSHLRMHRHRYRGVSWYVVEDQASGRVYRFTPAVYFLVGQMNGQRTVHDIWQDVVEHLGDDAPTQGEVVRLIAQLNAVDLLQTDVAPNPAEMAERFSKFTRARLRGNFGNPLAFKLPLWDPDRFLEALDPLVHHAFSKLGAAVWLSTIVPALVLVAMNWGDLTNNISDQVFTAENLLLAALVFPILKLCHELGHGFATKSAGGEVHELGVMFLVFAPIPYVDTSASIAFKDKWRRALVGAAGMATELFIAALATYLWVVVEPGVVRSAAYQVMLIAGISTIVFNANPLLRFDGYYILCDVLEISNLAARSGRQWAWLFQRYLFGVEDDPPAVTPGERSWLLAYAPISFVYRTFVLFGIAIFLATKYFIVGIVIAIWGLVMSFGRPVWRAFHYVLTSPQVGRRRTRAVLTSFACLTVLAAAIFSVPFPLHTIADGVIWLPEDSFIRAADAGFVTRISSQPGSQVAAGDILFEASEPDLDANARVLEAQVAALRKKLESEQFTDRVQADITRQDITLKESNLARAKQRLDALRLRSPNSGTFLVPAAQDLPGRYAQRGEILGYLIFQESRTARIVVTQDDIELVRNRLAGVQVKLTNRPTDTYSATVVREVPAASDRLPSKALTDIGGGHFAADPRDTGQTKTLQRLFQLDVELPPEAANSNFGSHVLVRFDHGKEPLGSQWYRRLRQLFLSRFET